MSRRLAYPTVALAVTLLGHALACTCTIIEGGTGLPDDVLLYLEKYDRVFVGEVVDAEDDTATSRGCGEEESDFVATEVLVTEAFKGVDVGDSVTVLWWREPLTSCDKVMPEVGYTALWFLYDSSQLVPACSSTAELSYRQDELEILREEAAP